MIFFLRKMSTYGIPTSVIRFKHSNMISYYIFYALANYFPEHSSWKTSKLVGTQRILSMPHTTTKHLCFPCESTNQLASCDRDPNGMPMIFGMMQLQFELQLQWQFAVASISIRGQRKGKANRMQLLGDRRLCLFVPRRFRFMFSVGLVHWPKPNPQSPIPYPYPIPELRCHHDHHRWIGQNSS